MTEPSTPAWHALEAADAVARLGVDPDAGLAADEAAARLRRSGPNELPVATRSTAWRILLRHVLEPLALVLLAAATVSFVVWLLEDDPEALPYDAIVILAVVALNGALGFLQEHRADRALRALERLTAPGAKVRRRGEWGTVAAREVVPGDIVLLEAGDRIPADVRLLEARRLALDESSLTGESVPASKAVDPVPADAGPADRADMAFMGTVVTSGRGLGVVVATGTDTEVGRIAGMLEEAETERTPLQRELGRLGGQLGWVALGISLAVGVAGALRLESRTPELLLEVFLFGVALAVAAVPEGLPTVVVATLALGVWRMAQRHAIIRQLPAVETLGSATVIASDKTGTLTRNQMTAVRILLGPDRLIEVEGEGFEPVGAFRAASGQALDPRADPDLERLLVLGMLASDARLELQEGRWSVLGDPTEGALVVAARKAGLDVARLRRAHPRLGEIPFSPERKRMTAIHEFGGGVTAVVKGAPETVFERCRRVRDRGTVREIQSADRETIGARNVALVRDALRTLALASREMPPGWGPDEEPDEAEVEVDLVWEGLFAMMDPPRSGVTESVSRARRAGVRTMLLTGDHVLTGRAVALRIGIAEEDEEALDGADLERLDDAALARRVLEVPVYGRVRPEHKVRIVRALQSRKQVVAMTGDGVNDAPALREADIGVAMGVGGTDVAREASDMVLADDDYSTIVNAIEEGRKIYGNIRKFVRYLLSANAGEVLTIVAAVALAGPLGFEAAAGGIFLPLLAVQILWVNLVTDGAPALALGIDPGEDDVMERPPRDPAAPIVDRPMWIRIGVVGLTVMVGTLFILDACLPGGLFAFAADASENPIRRARTMAFTTLVLFQLIDVFNVRHPKRSIFRLESFENRWLLAAVAFSLALQIMVVSWGPLQRGFGTVPLSAADWGLATAVAASVVVVVDAHKRTPWAP